MKYVFFTFLCFIGSFVSAQTNDDYCLLKIYRGAGSDKDSVKVKVYNQKEFNIPPNTIVTFKVYSEGGVVISANNAKGVHVPYQNPNMTFNRTENNSGHPTYFLQFESGKVIYMIASPGGGKNMLKEIEQPEFDKKVLKANPTTIDLEENMDKPIKKKSN